MLPVIPVIFTCILQGTFCDTGIPHNSYGEKICSVKVGVVGLDHKDLSLRKELTPTI